MTCRKRAARQFLATKSMTSVVTKWKAKYYRAHPESKIGKLAISRVEELPLLRPHGPKAHTAETSRD